MPDENRMSANTLQADNTERGQFIVKLIPQCRTICSNSSLPKVDIHLNNLTLSQTASHGQINMTDTTHVYRTVQRHDEFVLNPVHTVDTDETRLSCPVGDANWIGDKSRPLATENFETVSSSPEIRQGLLSASERLSYHWLPVHYRIRFKIATLTYKTLANCQPSYLYNLLQLHAPAITSSPFFYPATTPSTICLYTHIMSTDFGRRAFNYSSLATWNSIPTSIKIARPYIVSSAI